MLAFSLFSHQEKMKEYQNMDILKRDGYLSLGNLCLQDQKSINLKGERSHIDTSKAMNFRRIVFHAANAFAPFIVLLPKNKR